MPGSSRISRRGSIDNANARVGKKYKTGRLVYRAVPNNGGANYEYDNLFSQTPDIYGMLASTGTRDNEVFYIFGYEGDASTSSTTTHPA